MSVGVKPHNLHNACLDDLEELLVFDAILLKYWANRLVSIFGRRFWNFGLVNIRGEKATERELGGGTLIVRKSVPNNRFTKQTKMSSIPVEPVHNLTIIIKVNGYINEKENTPPRHISDCCQWLYLGIY